MKTPFVSASANSPLPFLMPPPQPGIESCRRCEANFLSHEYPHLLRKQIRSIGAEIDALQASTIASRWHQARLELLKTAYTRYTREVFKYAKLVG